jgi:hypothetical protein
MDRTRTYRHKNRSRLGHLRIKNRKFTTVDRIQSSPRITGYKILRAGEMKDLQRKVRVEIREGWVPLGGVSVCGGYAHAHFHQAMIKEASQ